MATRSKHARNLIGPSVARIRVANEMSQLELAARCQRSGWDISRGIVAAIEGRSRWVGDFEAAMLAAVLGVKISDLFPDEISWSELRIPDFWPRR